VTPEDVVETALPDTAVLPDEIAPGMDLVELEDVPAELTGPDLQDLHFEAEAAFETTPDLPDFQELEAELPETEDLAEELVDICYPAEDPEEECNGLDDDCDGETDEGLEGLPCPIENAWGVCAGTHSCLDGQWGQCEGTTPSQEVCDGKDNDCDTETDEFFPDEDGDGIADCVDDDEDGDGVPNSTDNCFGVPNEGQEDLDEDGVGDACDQDVDGDGVPNAEDCAPEDSAIHPFQSEQCNGVDDDCDGIADEKDAEGCANHYLDGDGDGYGVPVWQCLCEPKGTYTVTDSNLLDDCNDGNESVFPGNPEDCSTPIDDNCDGQANDAGAEGCTPWHKDFDGDGFGTSESACLCQPEGDFKADIPGDCLDADPAVNPDALEVCGNLKDDNCDGDVDGEGADGCVYWHEDADQDGHGGAEFKCLCEPEGAFSATSSDDCNDGDPGIYPGAPEVCNYLDDDCDEIEDPAGSTGCLVLFPDGDADGYGALAEPLCLCDAEPPYTASATGDCNDDDPDVFPSGLEVCDEKDNNCNGLVDEETLKTYYHDSDGDGVGAGAPVLACSAPEDHVEIPGDCDDDDPDVFPNGPELCDDKDNDCDGMVDDGVLNTYYPDWDNDQFGAAAPAVAACSAPEGHVENPGDCNDFNGDIYPGAPEVCNDLDEDCDWIPDNGLEKIVMYKDLDDDGFGSENSSGMAHCLVDSDGDGEGDSAAEGYSLDKTDCNDANSTVYPGAPELCADTIKNDCNLAVANSTCFEMCEGAWPVQIDMGIYHVTTAQMDKDNEWEIVYAGKGIIRVMEHDGTTKWEKAENTGYSSPALADMNGNGHLDIVQNLNGDTVIIDGWTGVQIASVPVGNAYHHYGLSIFDMDHDGTMDLIPSVTSPPHRIIYLNPDLTVKQTVDLQEPVVEQWVKRIRPGVFDLDGDGIPEVTIANDVGRFFVFNAAGELLNDPTGTDPEKPWFHVTGYPEWLPMPYQFPQFADVDGNGVVEVMYTYATPSPDWQNKEQLVWNQDGTQHELYGAEVPVYDTLAAFKAPVGPDGNLDQSGKLYTFRGPVADLDNDGLFENISDTVVGEGDDKKSVLAITKGGEVLDGWVGVTPSFTLLTDLDRDSRADVVFISGKNNSINCYRLGPDTYDERRILDYGVMDGLGRNRYRTGNLDPYEPNDNPSAPFVPADGMDPISASRERSQSARSTTVGTVTRAAGPTRFELCLATKETATSTGRKGACSMPNSTAWRKTSTCTCTSSPTKGRTASTWGRSPVPTRSGRPTRPCAIRTPKVHRVRPEPFTFTSSRFAARTPRPTTAPSRIGCTLTGFSRDKHRFLFEPPGDQTRQGLADARQLT